MNNQPGFYATEIRKQDFRRFGVPLLNLRADRSASTCVPDNNFVAPSLQFVKDVGRGRSGLSWKSYRPLCPWRGRPLEPQSQLRYKSQSGPSL